MRVLTIGFTKKTARRFFGLLRESGARRAVDVRISNGSQLSGFAKKDDLARFLGELCGIDYARLPELAPTEDLLRAWRKGGVAWADYEARFLDPMRARGIARLGEAAPASKAGRRGP